MLGFLAALAVIVTLLTESDRQIQRVAKARQLLVLSPKTREPRKSGKSVPCTRCDAMPDASKQGAQIGARHEWHFTESQLQELNRIFDFDQGATRRETLIKMQNQDGRWGFEAGRESEAYSTATALLILTQTKNNYSLFDSVLKEPHLSKGLQYLIDTQHKDGSWHVSSRANQVQEFFDNGDPHETDQFISMQATAWAVAALASAYHAHHAPLSTQASYDPLDWIEPVP